jgi:hypothetical protein
MKKLLFISLLTILISACSSYKSLDLNKLTTGMTKAQVEAQIGSPQRILAINETKDGYQEILEYRTSRDEVYGLEFWNDYLTGYEFLYDDVSYPIDYYFPPNYPTYFPEYGRPIIVVRPDNRPNRPNRPSQPNRPGRPETPTRPERPETNRPNLTRPTPGVRPSTRPTTRPSMESTPQHSIDRSGLGR